MAYVRRWRVATTSELDTIYNHSEYGRFSYQKFNMLARRKKLVVDQDGWHRHHLDKAEYRVYMYQNDTYQMLPVFGEFPTGPNQIWEADLIWTKDLHGIPYVFLTLIDVFSKYMWVYSIDSKTGQDMAYFLDDAVRSNNGTKPRVMWTDRGTEFDNAAFKGYCRNEGIQHSMQKAGQHLGYIERANKTIKAYLTFFDFNEIDAAQAYNTAQHRSLGMAPDTAHLDKHMTNYMVRGIMATDTFTRYFRPQLMDNGVHYQVGQQVLFGVHGGLELVYTSVHLAGHRLQLPLNT